LGRWNDAAKAYSEALNVMPGFYPARGNLMGVYNELGQYDKTILLGKVSVAWNPDFVSGRNNLANAYMRTNQPALALKQYTYLAAKADPASSSVYFGIGNCLVMQGRLADAAPWYQIALTWAPRDPGVHNNLGTVFYRLGRIQEAIQQYDEALQIAPNFADARSNLDNTLRALNNAAPAKPGQ
jgi:protein O-GlcNAc transferase